MVRSHHLVQNVAVWDRAIRFVISLLFILGSPLIVSGPWWLTIFGAFGGVQLFTGLTGY